jgi:hypothetical protein
MVREVNGLSDRFAILGKGLQARLNLIAAKRPGDPYCNSTRLTKSNRKTVMTHHKQKLPSKLCQVCGKSMSWRKKWQKNWDEVRHCSQRCRENKPKIALGKMDRRN